MQSTKYQVQSTNSNSQLGKFSDNHGIRRPSWIITQVNARSGQVIVFSGELFSVEMLYCFVVDTADGVTIRKDRLAVGVHIGIENRSFTDAARFLEQSPPRDFRIFFLAAEPFEERHTRQGFLQREVVDEVDATSEAFLITPSWTMKSSSDPNRRCSLGKRSR